MGGGFNHRAAAVAAAFLSRRANSPEAGLFGTQTHVRENDPERYEPQDGSIFRVDEGGTSIPKDQSKPDERDMGKGGPTTFTTGDPKNTYNPKTKYPYNKTDGAPSSRDKRDARAREVVAAWLLERDPRTIPLGNIKVAIKLSELVAGTSQAVLGRSAKCSAKLKRADRKNLRWTFDVNCGNDTHTVKVKAADGRATRVGKRDVRVACSCNFWRFSGPDFWAKKGGYLDGDMQSDGSAPTERDPSREHLICKHIAACVPTVSNFVAK